MELRQLRAFVAVAQEGTFTAAADRLVLVQSAVSATVRALEQELGTALFERTTRHVALTDAGRALLPEALGILEAARLALDAVDQTRDGIRGTLSVGIMQASAGRAVSVPRLIAGFQAQHPLVAINVRHVGGSQILAEQVRSGQVDLGILSLPGEFPGLTLTELRREPMLLACAAGHPLSARERVSIKDLVDEPFVDGPADWGTRLAADRLFASAGIPRTLRFEINDTSSIVEFVAEGLAVALLPRSMTAHAQTVRMVELEGEAPMFRTLLATPGSRRTRSVVQAFSEFVTQSASSSGVGVAL